MTSFEDSRPQTQGTASCKDSRPQTQGVASFEDSRPQTQGAASCQDGGPQTQGAASCEDGGTSDLKEPGLCCGCTRGAARVLLRTIPKPPPPPPGHGKTVFHENIRHQSLVPERLGMAVLYASVVWVSYFQRLVQNPKESIINN